MYDENKFEELVGKTLIDINVTKDAEREDDTILFTCNDGIKYKLYHYRDCCESVNIEDICGELSDLLNSPILLAEEVSHDNVNPEGLTKEWQDSFTWTFYKLATIKGYVTIRWYGESNGYYSESVDFVKLND